MLQLVAYRMGLGHIINKCGLHQLGDSTSSALFTCLEQETIVDVSSGYEHSAVVCESGRVFTLKKSESSKNGAISEPVLVDALHPAHRIVRAACGRDFTLFLSDKGELFACGGNVYGQLGTGDHDALATPRQVLDIPPVVQVAAGSYHTVALTTAGEVWVCGLNSDGQLGLGHDDSQATFTRVFSISHPIAEVACGEFHTALLSARSRVLLMTGLNHVGQLGLGATAKRNMHSFTSVFLPAVSAVACGSLHTVAITEDGSVWTWGSNACGQLGHGGESVCSSPFVVPGLENYTIAGVAAGCNRSAMLSIDGNVLVCGKDIPGAELGHTNELVTYFTLVTKSVDVAVKHISFTASYTLIHVVPRLNDVLVTWRKSTDQHEAECVIDEKHKSK